MAACFSLCLLVFLSSSIQLTLQNEEVVWKFLRDYSQDLGLLRREQDAIDYWRDAFQSLLVEDRLVTINNSLLLCEITTYSSMLISNTLKIYFSDGGGDTLQTSDINSVLYSITATLLIDMLLEVHQSSLEATNSIADIAVFSKPVCKNGLSPLEHATKLYNVYILQSMMSALDQYPSRYPHHGFCDWFAGFNCSRLYHLASIKQDIKLMELLVNSIPPDRGTVCQIYLTTYYICSLGLGGCHINQYITDTLLVSLDDGSCEEDAPTDLLIIRLLSASAVISDQPLYTNNNTMINTSTTSGYGVARTPHWEETHINETTNEGAGGGWYRSPGNNITTQSCDIPVINIEELANYDFTVLDYMSIPLLIRGGLLRGSPLYKEWSRSNLLAKYGDIEIDGGVIPYGEVFGERSGVSSIKEFILYMSHYNNDKGEGLDHHGNQPPLYIFDTHIIPEYFSQMVSVPSEIQADKLWSNASLIYQFILGPRGSGAPFHYHCNAINSLVYGRKRWYLYPPGKGYYSKLHPLNWKHDGKQLECVQFASDVVFVPSGWSHSTINIDDCIGHAIEFDTSDC